MSPNDYMKQAMRTEAPQPMILVRYNQLSANEAVKAIEASNALRGLTDEVGELASVHKKWLEYGGAEPDPTNILEECGDILWRTCQMLKAYDLNLEDAMKANLRKLSGHADSRYTDGFSNEAALKRDVEAETRRLVAEDDGVSYE